MEARIERPAGGTAWVIGDDEEVIVIDPGQDAAAAKRFDGWVSAGPAADPEIEMADAGRFDVADVQLEVLHTAGHTPGSVSLYCADLGGVFTGDALLAAGPAPHDGEFPDFPGQLTAIGERLLGLPPETRVLPGHGEESGIAAAAMRFDGWVSAGPAAELG